MASAENVSGIDKAKCSITTQRHEGQTVEFTSSPRFWGLQSVEPAHPQKFYTASAIVNGTDAGVDHVGMEYTNNSSVAIMMTAEGWLSLVS